MPEASKLFARALFGDAEAPVEVDADRVSLPPQAVIEKLRSAVNDSKRREQLIDIYTRSIVKGEAYSVIAAAYGITKGRVSEELRRVEQLTGETIRHGAAAPMRSLLERTRKAHEGAGRNASLYGWHSARATFVVLALSRGINIEVVKSIVGHSTVEMTLKYFNPTEKNAADVFASYIGGRLLAPGVTGMHVQAPSALPQPVRDYEAPMRDETRDGALEASIREALANGSEADRAKLEKLLGRMARKAAPAAPQV